MRTLAVDIGNTRISIGLFGDNGILSRRDILAGDFEGRHIDFSCEVHACAISRVSREALELEGQIRERLKCPVFELRDHEIPFLVHYEDVVKFGTDRLANVIAARRYAPGGAIVVDLGTATHFDIIDESGEIYAGPIMPGLETLHQALSMRISHLPHEKLSDRYHVLAHNTCDAINSGSLLCTAGGIERVLRELRACFKSETFKTIMTGGCASLVSALVPCDFLIPNLTLEGIHRYGELSMMAMSRKFSA